MNEKQELVFRYMDMVPFAELPNTLDQARSFFAAKGLDNSMIQDEMLEKILAKIHENGCMDPEEIESMHLLFNHGDTCGCDTE